MRGSVPTGSGRLPRRIGMCLGREQGRCQVVMEAELASEVVAVVAVVAVAVVVVVARALLRVDRLPALPSLVALLQLLLAQQGRRKDTARLLPRRVLQPRRLR